LPDPQRYQKIFQKLRWALLKVPLPAYLKERWPGGALAQLREAGEQAVHMRASGADRQPAVAETDRRTAGDEARCGQPAFPVLPIRQPVPQFLQNQPQPAKRLFRWPFRKQPHLVQSQLQQVRAQPVPLVLSLAVSDAVVPKPLSLPAWPPHGGH